MIANYKFYKGSLIIIAGIVLNKILAMTNNIILARFLEPYYFGLFFLGISILEIISVPANFGIPGVLPKLVAQYKSQKNKGLIEKTVSVSLGICFIISLFFSIILFFYADMIAEDIFNSKELAPLLSVFAWLVPFYVNTFVLVSVLRGYQTSRLKVIYQDILPPGLKILFFILFFYAGFGFSAAYFAFAISTLVIFSLTFIKLKTNFIKNLKIRFKPQGLSLPLIKLAWPLSLQSLIWVIYSQIDRLSIGYYLSPREVGIYCAAFSLATLLSIIPQGFSFLSLPEFSKLLAENSFSKFKIFFRQIAELIFTISLPLFICLVIFAKDLLKLLYGPEFSNGFMAIIILSSGLLANTIWGPASDALVGAGHTKSLLLSTLCGCIANIIFNILFIPLFGIKGAALATSVSMIISCSVTGIFNYHYFKLFPLNINYLSWAVLCSLFGIILAKIQLKFIFFNYPLFDIILKSAGYLMLLLFIRYFFFYKRRRIPVGKNT